MLRFLSWFLWVCSYLDCASRCYPIYVSLLMSYCCTSFFPAQYLFCTLHLQLWWRSLRLPCGRVLLRGAFIQLQNFVMSLALGVHFYLKVSLFGRSRFLLALYRCLLPSLDDAICWCSPLPLLLVIDAPSLPLLLIRDVPLFLLLLVRDTPLRPCSWFLMAFCHPTLGSWCSRASLPLSYYVLSAISYKIIVCLRSQSWWLKRDILSANPID